MLNYLSQKHKDNLSIREKKIGAGGKQNKIRANEMASIA